jgi:G:T-mismatch repair DNA endonuclease (very short patch repair protein)
MVQTNQQQLRGAQQFWLQHQPQGQEHDQQQDERWQMLQQQGQGQLRHEEWEAQIENQKRCQVLRRALERWLHMRRQQRQQQAAAVAQ